MKFRVTLEININPDECVDDPGLWDWPALLDMLPEDVEMVSAVNIVAGLND